uniref:Uncharacterized protein n=1 Tax=Tanacetum cinerariifolium TaxID=118510 RepID=A0A6L2NQN6_TANCI|nr:hypothetical protein [Tanacetum cinerariifolium]
MNLHLIGYTTCPSQYTPTPPPDKADKGNGIAQSTYDNALKEIMPFMEEGGSTPNLSNLKHFRTAKEGVATTIDKLSIPPPLNYHQLSKKKKRIAEIVKEVLILKDIVVDGMHRNLTPPQGITSARDGQVFKEPEAGILKPKIDDKYHFELKGQFLKELRDNAFSGSNHEDANEHIEKVLQNVDLFHIPNITQDQTRSTETSNGLAAIQAQLNNLSKEIKTVNEKVYAAQVGLMENIDGYRDQDMGDVIFREPLCKASCVEARRFNKLITIHNGNANVTYQMARSHPSRSLDHPCSRVLPSCEVVTLGPAGPHFLEHNIMHQSCGSCVVAAATVGIPASGFAAVKAVLKPERLKVDKARNE